MTDAENEFAATFEELRAVLKPHESALLLKVDSPDEYSLDTPYPEEWKKELFFGAVQIRKNYVSFHLFPVYMYPELLDAVSGDLRIGNPTGVRPGGS